MAEKYVSVSALRELLSIPSDGDCEKCNHHKYHGCYNDELVRACEAIDDAPEADVVEVVHGMWEERVEQRTYAGGFLTMHYKACSICGCDPLRDENEDWALSNFCPHCGADMRGAGTE